PGAAAADSRADGLRLQGHEDGGLQDLTCSSRAMLGWHWAVPAIRWWGKPTMGRLYRVGSTGSFDQVAAVVELLDLALQPRLDLHPLLERQVPGALLEQVVVEVEVLQVHLRVEDVFLVDVDVEHLVARADVLGQVVLDRVDLVVDV